MAKTKRSKIWPEPDYEMLINEKGRLVAFFIKELYEAIPASCPAPYVPGEKQKAEQNERYIAFVRDCREKALLINDTFDIVSFWETAIQARMVASRVPGNYFVPIEWERIITKKVLKLQEYKFYGNLKFAADAARFGMTADELIIAEHKFYLYDGKDARIEVTANGSYCVKVERYGFTEATGIGGNVDPNRWQLGTYFAIRDGVVVICNANSIQDAKTAVLKVAKEAGFSAPPVPQSDRGCGNSVLDRLQFGGADFRNGRDITREEFKEMFNLCNVDFGDSMPKYERQVHLNMAFDALSAMAEVLGITTESIGIANSVSLAFGARGKRGANAHYEPRTGYINLSRLHGAGALAHEWGHAVESTCHYNTMHDGVVTAYETVCRDMRETNNGVHTEYLSASKKSDGDETPYYARNDEMFARAFACYVHDKLTSAGIVVDYLVGQAEHGPVPQGEERERLNRDFDKLFEELRKSGLLRDSVERQPSEAEESADSTLELFEGAYGQLGLFAPIAASHS